jgi:hypothetical protein
VDGLLSQVTLEEKIGQLVHYSAGIPIGPRTVRAGYPLQIASGQAGSFENLVGTAQLNTVQGMALEKPPSFMSGFAELASRFPSGNSKGPGRCR